ncbi:MAG: hypothetical protein COU25_01210 [Candidatus Levybacteria bacterium CG10_big_fil_rev_8_21_14_0_10_35_13]|nr:MAG: hypothetical protein COU25_01210 [Candidatus Levybacteria bacterium CG10_big_fil_rev_8_21_14_0_10_35_13]
MKSIFFIFIFIIFAVIGAFLYFNNDKTISSSKVIIKGKEFNAEIANSAEDKQTGLAKYNKINDNFMMVFPFNKKGYYTFWMKDMKFSIDIIYVADNKVVDIFKNVPFPKKESENLPRYTSSLPADTVLEINAGLFDKYGFKIGDSIKITY